MPGRIPSSECSSRIRLLTDVIRSHSQPSLSMLQRAVLTAETVCVRVDPAMPTTEGISANLLRMPDKSIQDDSIMTHNSSPDPACWSSAPHSLTTRSGAKGRCKNFGMLRECRNAAAVALASGLEIYDRWIPSKSTLLMLRRDGEDICEGHHSFCSNIFDT